MTGFDLSSVVDADLYIESSDGASKEIGFDEALEYANKPLDPEIVKQYSEPRATTHGKRRRKAVAPEKKVERMKDDYFDHVTGFNYRLVLEDEKGENYDLVGHPRTDLNDGDFTTLIFPNIIPFYLDSDLENHDSNENPNLVMREMAPYDEEIENMMVSDAEFTGETSYDREVASAVRGDRRNWIEKPDNFAYVDEPRDFLALNGVDGLYDEAKDTEIPEITSSDWKMLFAEDDKLVGIRPFYDEIWDAGLNPEDAEMLGKWRGVNRGIGRWVYDMDDEFFHGLSGDERIIGFYDNEMPFAVGSDKAFQKDIRGIHNQRIREASGTEDFVENSLESVMKEEEETVAEIVKNEDLEYTDFIPRKVDEDLIPEDMKADKLF